MRGRGALVVLGTSTNYDRYMLLTELGMGGCSCHGQSVSAVMSEWHWLG